VNKPFRGHRLDGQSSAEKLTVDPHEMEAGGDPQRRSGSCECRNEPTWPFGGYGRKRRGKGQHSRKTRNRFERLRSTQAMGAASIISAVSSAAAEQTLRACHLPSATLGYRLAERRARFPRCCWCGLGEPVAAGSPKPRSPGSTGDRAAERRWPEAVSSPRRPGNPKKAHRSQTLSESVRRTR
jgi:hypothetical protein